MTAFILSIGDELTLGQTVDTNSAWLSQQLAAVGIDVRGHMTVGDSQSDIEFALRTLAARFDILLLSGGLGPTADDLTRQALAAVLNVELESHQPWIDHLQQYFQRANRSMPESNKVQAMIPKTARLIWNNFGTAAGIEADIPGDSPCRLFALPGVPKEMKGMFAEQVLPRLQSAGGGAAVVSRTLHTFGLGEAAVGERLVDLMKRGRNPSVGTTVANNVVSLRINARFPSREQAESEAENTITACRAALGDLIYGQDEDTLPSVIARLLISPHSASANRTSALPSITTAESCTGGLLAKYLTDIPGSSAYFKQSWVTYSNEAKHDRLGVPTEVLNLYGAVSEPVVQHMARNARRLARATYALAISGIAGPDGGSKTKPVGTVCIALASPASPSPGTPGEGRGEGDSNPSLAPSRRDDFITSTLLTRTFTFPGDREMIRDRSAKMALALLRLHLLNLPIPF